MAISILVENNTCGGCANSVQRGLKEDPQARPVPVTVEQGLVEGGAGDAVRSDLVARLAKLGYPGVDTVEVEGAPRLEAKARSFVSCAIGRRDK